MKHSINKIISNTKVYVIAACLLLTAACDKKFEEMNRDPNAYNEPVVPNIFSYSLVNIAGVGDDRDWGNGSYASGFMQYFASLDTHLDGEKYLYDQGYNDVFFEAGYHSHLKEIQQIIALIKDDAEQVNTYAMARIMRVYAFQRITDLYGDIPYFEAEKGFNEGVLRPKYDRQADIYADMLKELDESAQLLDPAKSNIGAADLIYAGDINKWKRFAYSLMLRVAMRITDADAGMAETYVKKAIAGGVMQSNDDIALLKHTSGTGLNWNWDAWYQNNEELPPALQGHGSSKLCATFIDFLKSNNDPRLPFFATLWEGNVDPSKLAANSDPAKQKGLPPGYDFTSIKTLIPDWTDDKYLEYSEINLNTIANLTAPSIYQSYAEVELLLAEAAIRGWDQGSAADHYNKAVTASMQMTTLFPGGFSISSSDISQYLADHPFGGSEAQQMEQIGNQYWVAHFFVDNIEAYSNWRRTGYPTLTPVNYPGNQTGGVIPRRLLYPQSERVHNTENYNAAVAAQGSDNYLTPVWWDK
jgi:hypothetical protein